MIDSPLTIQFIITFTTYQLVFLIASAQRVATGTASDRVIAGITE